MHIEGAIFDMDGTLLESMHIWNSASSLYLESRGICPPADLRSQIRNLSLEQGARYFQEHFGLRDSVQAIMDGVNSVIESAYRDSIQPKPGARAFLEKLRARGLPLCIATATDRHLVEMVLTRTGLRPFFGEIFTCGDVGAGKDQPLIFQRALDFLGTVRERTWVFEDALYAARTAKSAGFPVAALRDPFEPEQEKLRVLADLYAASLEEMGALLD